MYCSTSVGKSCIKMADAPKIFKLPNEVLCEVFEYLDFMTVITVIARVCKRFNNIANNPCAWKNVTIKGTHFNLANKFFLPTTKRFQMIGESNVNVKILHEISRKMKNITLLSLESVRINCHENNLAYLPRCITHLSIKNCNLLNVPILLSYFTNIEAVFPHLTYLNLQGSDWLGDFSLLAISKCVHLRTLILRNCINIGRQEMNFYLAVTLGFRSLKIIDLRETRVTDKIIRLFRCSSNIQQLYIGGGIPYFKIMEPNLYDDAVYLSDECLPHYSHLQVFVASNTSLGSLQKFLKTSLRLKVIDLRGTYVTAKQQQELEDLFPRVVFVKDSSKFTDFLSKGWMIDNEIPNKYDY